MRRTFRIDRMTDSAQASWAMVQAVEEDIRVLSCITGADLSANQYYGVKFVPGSVNTVVLVGSPQDGQVIGILQDKPIGNDSTNTSRGIGRAVDVAIGGGSKVACGGTLAAGDRFCFDSTGRAVTTAIGSAWSMGIMREAGSVGNLASCVIQPTGQDAALNPTPADQFATSAGATPLTLTGPQVAGANDVTVQLTGVLAGAGTLNLPTAAQIVAAIANAVVGMTYKLRIVNTQSGAFAWTLTGNASVTVTGTATINQNTWRDFVVTLTSLTAVAVQSTGATGTSS